MLSLRGRRALAPVGRAGRFGGPARASGLGVALQTAGSTAAANVLRLALGNLRAALAPRKVQADSGLL